MIIDVTDTEKLNSFLGFCDGEIIPGKEKISREKTEKVVISLVDIINALLKSESLFLKNDLDLQNDFSFKNYDIKSSAGYIHRYLKNFNTEVFKFSKTERQTFLFVLENIEEYFDNIGSYSQKKDKNTCFSDYSFWFNNFIKVFEQKIRGEIRREPDDSGSGKLIRFNSDNISFSLSPFVIVREEMVFFLREVKSGVLEYSDINGNNSRSFIEKNLNETLFNFLFNNLNLKSAELIINPVKRSAANDLRLAKNALVAYSRGLHERSFEYLLKLSSYINEKPQFLLLQLGNLEKLARSHDMKGLIDKFIMKYPQYHQGYEILGRTYEKEGQSENAVLNFEKSLKIFQSRNISEKIKKLKTLIRKDKERNDKDINNEMFIDILSSVKNREETFYHRDNELRQIIEILISDSRKNLIIIGDSGVGKSTLIKMLGERIYKNDVPDLLKNKKIKEINFVSLLIGTKYRGQFEEKVVKLLNEFKLQNSILVLEDIHLMMSQGVSRGTSLDLINILKQFLRDMSIQVIATTSYTEYKNALERDPAFLSYFQKLIIKEMTLDQTKTILREHSKRTAEKDNILISDEIIEIIVENCRKSLPEKKLPDAALMIYDRCISRIRLRSSELEETVLKVCEEDAEMVLSDILNLPESSVSISNRDKLKELESNIKKEIIGQDQAVKRLVSGIISSKLGYEVNRNRPDGVFMFVGPTGVGKSETALVLAKYLLGSRGNVIRIDMSEYMEKFTYSRFVGAAPGYVGYNDATQLTDKIRKNPYSIVLLDEIEKADYQLLNIFLQIFDAGRLTDARGNEIDFSHTTIIMTSNIGTALYSKKRMGYGEKGEGEDVSVSALQKSLKRFFSPEFLNRVDDIVVFNTLSLKNVEKIMELQLSNTVSKLKKEGKTLRIPGEVKSFLVRTGYSAEYGARNIARILKKKILEKIAVLSLSEGWTRGNVIECFLSDDIEVRIVPSEIELEMDRVIPFIENAEK